MSAQARQPERLYQERLRELTAAVEGARQHLALVRTETATFNRRIAQHLRGNRARTAGCVVAGLFLTPLITIIAWCLIAALKMIGG